MRATLGILSFIFFYVSVTAQSFDSGIEIPFSGVYAQKVCSGDIDLDGDLDLFVLTQDFWGDNIIWLENNGNLSFNEHNLGLPNDPPFEAVSVSNIVTGDAQNDGDLDLFTLTTTGGPNALKSLGLYTNYGSGGFTSCFVNTIIGCYSAMYMSERGLWYRCHLHESSTFITNDELDCSGQSSGIEIDYYSIDGFISGDYDNDGDFDMICYDYLDDAARYFNNEGNSYSFSNHLFLDTEIIPFFVSFDNGFIHGNEVTSVVASHSDKIWLYKNDGNANFDTQVLIDNENGYTTFADLNLDGLDDILISSNSVSYMMNLGNEMFSDPIELISGTSSYHIIEDFNQDGSLDILSIQNNKETIKLYLNQSILGCTNSDACNFLPEASIDDNSCCYDDCGCLDQSALNYDPNSPCSNFCLYTMGDGNGDGLITSEDLSLFLTAFGSPCEEGMFCFGNFNGDGLISSSDLVSFLSVYGTGG